MATYDPVKGEWCPKHPDATHIRKYLNDHSAPEEFKKGLHGLMFRYGDDFGWVRTTVEESRLTPINIYRGALERRYR
jgi:hypothetical protein|tara:strand:- start:463 stop:693 length:231 start_codon:yes stop_codon:yes gene_type:complete